MYVWMSVSIFFYYWMLQMIMQWCIVLMSTDKSQPIFNFCLLSVVIQQPFAAKIVAHDKEIFSVLSFLWKKSKNFLKFSGFKKSWKAQTSYFCIKKILKKKKIILLLVIRYLVDGIHYSHPLHQTLGTSRKRGTSCFSRCCHFVLFFVSIFKTIFIVICDEN